MVAIIRLLCFNVNVYDTLNMTVVDVVIPVICLK